MLITRESPIKIPSLYRVAVNIPFLLQDWIFLS